LLGRVIVGHASATLVDLSQRALPALRRFAATLARTGC
jgi:hypothetical protein